jgi:hypothetical protein
MVCFSFSSCSSFASHLLLYLDDFCDSKILSGESRFRRQLAQWLPGKGVWDICWRASRDGWAASRFHAGCDNKGPTVTIVQVGRYIFGGYTDVSWAGMVIVVFTTTAGTRP